MTAMRPVLAAMVLGVAVALGVGSPAAALTTLDMTGREVRLAAPPERIVSLVPSVTEILFALGAAERLVGVTDYCDFPPAARAKPSVGGMVSPSLEAIVALRPDLVIGTTEGSREETFTQLRRLGVPVYLVAAHRLADVDALIRRLADLAGGAGTAKRVLADLGRRIDAVRKAVASRARRRVLYVVWPEPLVVPGRDALVSELIELAGGSSVTAVSGDAYPRVSLEAVAAGNPEVIILARHGTAAGAVDREKWERFANVAAVRSGRIHAVDGNLTHRYGPRIVDGLETLARLIHPEAFR
ncbi:MAG: cobalamin-binding protein [Candidatus Rokubacteria bacterium]|nr:cobalamin-binding protein [Candidatus Rokubacteria bacterium]